uniref:AlNc14C99G5990 protein n=1 Tax=Albugo laibachii Nc14 TaxID=890382 RepID=F0WHC6_9STRA|nr:AlNc14C99G5990 [Albugo laibachii Nc14]|eukprot:CCA20644.1 AlNc14C99G5990 [Albugo laibachii Nc14]
MLIKHDSTVKCADVNNHREEDSGNKDNRRTTNEDNNDSWSINNSDSSDIGSGTKQMIIEEEVTHGVAENIEKAFNAALSTRSNLENPTRPARYIGQSKCTQRRKIAAFKCAAVGTKPLTAYFIKQMAEHEQEGEEIRSKMIPRKLKAMKEKGKASQAAQNRNDAVNSYLCLVKAGFKRGEATMFMNDGELPISHWGKHAERLSYLKDEDWILHLQHYMRKNKFKVDISELTAHINESILPQLGYAPSPTISKKTQTLAQVPKHNLS